MVKTKGKNLKKHRKPKPMKIAALIVSAIHDLRETKGSTPRKIAGYISYASNVSEGRVKRQVNAALRKGVKYGILRRYRGHYFLPSGDELDRANRIAIRFARLPTPASSTFKSHDGLELNQPMMESLENLNGMKAGNNIFVKAVKWPNRTQSLPESSATIFSNKVFDKNNVTLGSDVG